MQTSVNLQKIRQWPWKKIFFVSVVGILVLSAILRVLTPDATQVPLTTSIVTNDEGVQTVFRNMEYVGESPSFPLTLPGLTPIANQQDLLQAIVTRFQLSEMSEGFWESSSFQLSQQGNETDMTYTLSNKTDIPTTPISSKEDLEAESNQVIQEMFPNLSGGNASDPSVAWTQTTPPLLAFSDGLHLEAAAEGKANLMVTAYAPTLQGIPIYFDKATRPPIELLLRETGDIQKLSFTTNFLPVTQANSYSLLSIEQALRNINEKNIGVVILSTRERFGAIELSELQSGTLTEVELEYRYDPIANLIYPHYLFRGTAINKERANLGVEILTPAVPVNLTPQAAENE